MPATADPTSIEAMDRDGETCLLLPARFDTEAAERISDLLRDRVLAGAAIEADASRVEQLSTMSLQVLVVAARSAAARRQPFALRHPSPAMTEALALLGLQNALPSRVS